MADTHGGHMSSDDAYDNFERVHSTYGDSNPSESDFLRQTPPRAGMLSENMDSPSRVSLSQGTRTPDHSAPLLTEKNNVSSPALAGSDVPYVGVQRERRKSWLRRWPWWLLLLAGFILLSIVVLAVFLPIYFIIIRPHQPSKEAQANPASPTGATTGGNGSIIVTADGTQFTYINNFGGFWVEDPQDPFNDNARPNSWTPPLNTSWTWGIDKVNGVNLGGWFVLEPFITPSLFQKYQSLSYAVIDEWTLSLAMRNDTASGGISQLEDHYNTFITEQDIAQIAGAGLNWVRLPIPYWAIETWDGEPFLAQTSWKYILRLLGWARKYGLRVNLDLHTVPGSQNGYNHSGKEGQINWLRGVMGIANAQRTLGYIRIITEFISQSEYQNLIPMFGVVNEALLADIGRDPLTRIYLQVHNMMRGITGFGTGHGPYMSIHDGFQGISSWAGFLPGSDRIMLDTHPYFAFNGQPNTEPLDTWAGKACNSWAPGINASQTGFGVTVAGEFSAGFNDCGLYLTGVNGTNSYGGDCNLWMDASQWNQTVIQSLLNYTIASMDALQNYWYWTWKIDNSSDTNTVQAPLWSYQLGLQGGWIPPDPRVAAGTCASFGTKENPFNGAYESWQTGGAGAGTIDPTVSASFSQYPPPSMSGLPGNSTDPALAPTYTSTGTVATLPPPTLTVPGSKSTISAGNGWFDAQDTGGGATTVSGCSYPDAWDSDGVTMPTALCTGPSVARRTANAEPMITKVPNS